MADQRADHSDNEMAVRRVLRKVGRKAGRRADPSDGEKGNV